MKKSLLLASALLTATSAFAATDAAKYEKFTEGEKSYTFTNRWLTCLNQNPAVWENTPLLKSNDGATCRTACIYNDMIIIGNSAKGSLLKFDLASGEYLGAVQLTVNGENLSGTLCANQVGVDDYNNLYVASFASDLLKNAQTLYTVDLATGVMTPQGVIDIQASENLTAASYRVDYFNVIGDITGKENIGQYVAVPATAGLAAIRFTKAKGTDTWVGAFEGDPVWYIDSDAPIETYPAGITDWGTAPVAKFVKDEEFTGETFYIDGFTSCPSLYNMSGAMIGGFNQIVKEEQPDVIIPAVGTNGVAELSIKSDNFVVYSLNQYVNPNPCMAQIGYFGEGFEYSEMKGLWSFPEGGMGLLSDGGVRIHGLDTRKYTDKNGKEGVYITTFKCCNGLGVYVLAEEGFEDPNGAVEGIEIDDVDAAPVYYNLQGVQVANPENGLYIVKRGNKVTKEVIRK